MKNILFILFATGLLFTACTTGTQETATEDSTKVAVDSLRCDSLCADSMHCHKDSTKH